MYGRICGIEEYCFVEKGKRMMKKRLSLSLFLLSCMLFLKAEDYKDTIQAVNSADHWMLHDKRLSSKKRKKLLRCCGIDSHEMPCCKRGKTGKRGPRGRRGPSGENSCGSAELFLNAPMMTSSGEGGGYPADSTFTPYTPVATVLPSWQVRPSNFEDTFVEGIFNIPADLDITQPVTAVMHFLIPSFDIPIGIAHLRIDMIYLPNNDLLGFTPPAAGLDDTQFSGDFLVMSAAPIGSDNLRHISVSVPLDPTVINGQWALIGVSRVAPAGLEYAGDLYLSTISIQYSRICS